MLSPKHLAELAKLRRFRAAPARSQSLDAEFSKQAAEFRRMAKGLGPLAAAWAEVVPTELAARTVLAGVSRGTLTVRVQDAGTMHELARLLRGGGEREVIRRAPTAIRRVKLTLGSQ